MATNICENERCTYHRPLPVKDAGAPYIDTMEGDKLAGVLHVEIEPTTMTLVKVEMVKP